MAETQTYANHVRRTPIIPQPAGVVPFPNNPVARLPAGWRHFNGQRARVPGEHCPLLVGASRHARRRWDGAEPGDSTRGTAAIRSNPPT